MFLAYISFIFFVFFCSFHGAWAVVNDTQLLQALNFSLPALAKVKYYYELGNTTAAISTLAQYYRNRPGPAYFNNTAIVCEGSDIMSTPDQVVEGLIYVLNEPYKFPNGSLVNWHFNPTINSTKYPYSPEWQWALNRMCFWPGLGAAYSETQSKEYATVFMQQLSSWIDTCPRPLVIDENPGSSWRTIEAGIRGGYTWMDAWHRFLNSTYMDDETIILWVKSWMDHGEYLHKFNMPSGNWVTMEMNGLFSAGSLFPEFLNATSWRQYAGMRLLQLSTTEFLPDGAWQELTTGYMQISINNIFWLFQIAQLYGTEGDLPQGYLDPLYRAFTFDVNVMTPSRVFPLVNDAWFVSAVDEAQLAILAFPSDPVFNWLASGGTTGREPNYTSVICPSSGYVAMRTGWGWEDTFGFMDCAPLGTGHIHQDKLNLLIDTYGRRLLYDGGGGQYNVDKWRSYAIDTPSHNTITIDGQPQRRVNTAADPIGYGNPKTPQPTFETNAQFDYVTGVYMDNYSTTPIATHKREVVFWKDQILAFVVLDTLTPNDNKPHNYTALWNFLSTQYQVEKQYNLVYTTDKGLPNLAILPLSPNTESNTFIAVNTSTEILGWDIDRAPPFEIPALEVIHSKDGVGLQQFMTLILPLWANTSHNITNIQYGTNAWKVSFEPGQILAISTNANNARQINVTLIA